MPAYDLEEQEKIEELKTWWKQHGGLVTGVLFVAVLALSGWQGWNWWHRNQSAQASQIFAQLQEAAGQGDAKRSKELAGSLIEKFSMTRYADMGAMISAKVLADAADAKNARAQLEWVAKNANDKALRDVARLRIAAMLVDERDYDLALSTLSADPHAEFKVSFLDLTGDIHALSGKVSEAVKAYQQALDLVAQSERESDADGKRRAAAYRDVLSAKMDSLGMAVASTVSSGKESK